MVTHLLCPANSWPQGRSTSPRTWAPARHAPKRKRKSTIMEEGPAAFRRYYSPNRSQNLASFVGPTPTPRWRIALCARTPGPHPSSHRMTPGLTAPIGRCREISGISGGAFCVGNSAPPHPPCRLRQRQGADLTSRPSTPPIGIDCATCQPGNAVQHRIPGGLFRAISVYPHGVYCDLNSMIT